MTAARRARWGSLALAGLMLAGQGAAAAGSPAGSYRLSAGPDVASELVLLPDGRFTYFLAAGALDERAAGHWRADGGTLRLTTEPTPVPPVFTAGAASITKEAPLVVHVVAPGGQGIAGVDLRVGFDAGEDVESYTQDYGWSLPAGETRVPRWIELSVPMHALRSPRFPIDVARGNLLNFMLTPNDLGVIDFAGVQVDVAPGELVVHRDGALLEYRAQ